MTSGQSSRLNPVRSALRRLLLGAPRQPGAEPRWRRRLRLPGAVTRLRAHAGRWQALCAIAYLACLAALTALDMQGGRVGVAGGTALVLAAGAPTAARLRHDILDAPGVWAAVSMAMFGPPSLAWLGAPLVPAPGVTRGDVANALLLVASGLVVFGIAARLFGKAARRPGLTLPESGAPPNVLLGGLLLISVLASLAGIAAGAVGSYGSHASPGALSELLALATAIGTIVVVVAAMVAFALRRAYRMLLVAAAVQFAVGFLGGFKLASIVVLMIVAAAYVACGGRIRWRPVVAVAILTIVVLIPANAVYRYLRQPAAGERAPSVAQVFTGNIDRYLFYRFRLIDHVALIQSQTPSVYPYASPSYYEYLPLLIVVPRALWPDKPALAQGSEFSRTYWQIPPYLTTWTPLTQVGDLYRTFSYLGVGIGLFVWGLIVGASSFLARRWRSPRTEVIYLFWLVTFVTLVEEDLPGLVATASKSLLVVAAVSWLLLPGRRGVAGYRWLLSRVSMGDSWTHRIGGSEAAPADGA